MGKMLSLTDSVKALMEAQSTNPNQCPCLNLSLSTTALFFAQVILELLRLSSFLALPEIH